MIVVSDTSPLNYLILIEVAHVLPQLYGTVLVPEAVVAELSSIKTPSVVRAWVDRPPPWLVITEPTVLMPATTSLDNGEAAAISLAC